jgi:site-specific DNA-adenine methylase
MKPRRALGYARVSSVQQVLGTSLDDQQRAIRAYAESLGVPVAKMYVEAESGIHEKIERRHQMQALMADAREGDAVYFDPPFQGTHSAFCADGAEWEAKQATLPGLGESSARERLAAELQRLDRIGVRWTLSDADTKVTRLLYRGWPVEVVARQNSVTCKAEDRGDGATEGLWRNWQ